MSKDRRSRSNSLWIHAGLVVLTILIVLSPTLYRSWRNASPTPAGNTPDPSATVSAVEERPVDDDAPADASLADPVDDSTLASSPVTTDEPSSDVDQDDSVAAGTEEVDEAEDTIFTLDNEGILDGYRIPEDMQHLVRGDIAKAIQSYRFVPGQYVHEYVVRPGDRLDEISERFYGTKQHWRMLQAHLGLPSAADLREGKQIRLPRLKAPAEAGEVVYEIGATHFAQGRFNEALRLFELIIEQGDIQSDVVVRAHFSAGRSVTDAMRFKEWKPNHEFIRGSESRRLKLAIEHFSMVVDNHEDHDLADDAARMIAGCHLRAGRFAEALDWYGRVAERWPDGSAAMSRSRDNQWCHLAMAFRFNSIPADQRRYLVEVMPAEAQEGRLFSDGRHVIHDMSAGQFKAFAKRLAADDVVAGVYSQARMPSLPLSARGVSGKTRGDAMEAATWLEHLGHHEACVALARAVWAQGALDRRSTFTFTYLRSLIQLGRVEEALSVAADARLPEVYWIVLGNLVPVEMIEQLVAAPPSWMGTDLELLTIYALGLRYYASQDYQLAWDLFWALQRDYRDEPIAVFARTRLFELYQFVWPERLNGDWTTAYERVIWITPDGQTAFDPAFAEAAGVDRMTGQQRKTLLGYLRIHDAFEGARAKSTPEQTSAQIRLAERMSELARSAMNGDFYSALPDEAHLAVQRGIRALRPLVAGRSKAPRYESDDRYSVNSEWLLKRGHANRWEQFHYLLQTVGNEYMVQRDLESSEEFRDGFAVLLDVSWNLLRLQDRRWFKGSVAAERWHSLGRYYMNNDPFVMPGRSAEDNWARGLLSTAHEPSQAIISSRLRGARYRVAQDAFERSDAISPSQPDNLFNIAMAIEMQSDLLWNEMTYWWQETVRALQRYDLVETETASTLASVSKLPEFLRSPFRSMLPRMAKHDELAHDAISAYERAADLTGSKLADDALGRVAGLINGRGLGSIESALDYYQRAIALEGDQRDMLIAMRDAIDQRRDGPTLEPEMLNLASVLLSSSRFRTDGRGNTVPFNTDVWESSQVASFAEFRIAVSVGALERLPGLLTRVVGDDWSHPMTVYLLELWYAALETPSQRALLVGILDNRLQADDLGAIQYYVRTVLGRTLIDVGLLDQAYEHLLKARAESPFDMDVAIAMEFRRLAATGYPTDTIEPQWFEIPEDITRAFVGLAAVPIVADKAERHPSFEMQPFVFPW